MNDLSAHSFFNILSRRFISLYLPYLIWSFISWFVIGGNQRDIYNYSMIFKNPFESYWFLDILFFSIIVIEILWHAIFRNAKLFLLLILLIILDLISHLYLNSILRAYYVAYYGLYIALGFAAFYFIKSFPFKMSLCDCHVRKFNLAYLVVFSILAIFLIYGFNFSREMVFHDNAVINFVLNTLLSYSHRFLIVVLAGCVFYFCFIMFPWFIKYPFVYLGVVSLEIYLIHLFVMNILMPLDFGFVLYGFSTTLVTLVSIFLMRYLARYSSACNTTYGILFGRKII